MGDEICNPWNISVELNKAVSKEIKEDIDKIVKDEINNHKKITNDLINNKIKLNSY